MFIFMKSMIVGLCIAAPVGPIGFLCIQRSLMRGWRSGFATGLGAATADAMYGFIGALGITAIITTLITLKPWLCIFGGLFLAYIGYQTIRSKEPATALSGEKAGIMKAYSTTLLLTLSNPMTILSFIALFASMSDGMVGDQGQYSMWSMVTGIFLGSAVWWLGLSGFSSAFKTRMSESRLKLINYFSGSTITVLAAYQVVVGIMLVIEV
ncbi:Threonine/homoserine/homoserine lactone efflux protein [Pseudomonas grimontii]|jgi:threonine/homoserine/homoserine lactone efflux protein|uniref:LysE family translocator n=1 Tax=Pseudomonas grimontii TaxID=129847 RepID=A0A1H0XLC3_9PSED|nr:LysE family transporter [Pseudomonas grimontii]TWR62434.1 LysE family translocator [Pseudomonas grimontii]SDQ03426.1 Threonine/homoserine/homoserine lactone efflux protein [Pseudomonas grimontii]